MVDLLTVFSNRTAKRNHASPDHLPVVVATKDHPAAAVLVVALEVVPEAMPEQLLLVVLDVKSLSTTFVFSRLPLPLSARLTIDDGDTSYHIPWDGKI